jgi:hypothetical protein
LVLAASAFAVWTAYTMHVATGIFEGISQWSIIVVDQTSYRQTHAAPKSAGRSGCPPGARQLLLSRVIKVELTLGARPDSRTRWHSRPTAFPRYAGRRRERTRAVYKLRGAGLCFDRAAREHRACRRSPADIIEGAGWATLAPSCHTRIGCTGGRIQPCPQADRYSGPRSPITGAFFMLWSTLCLRVP